MNFNAKTGQIVSAEAFWAHDGNYTG